MKKQEAIKLYNSIRHGVIDARKNVDLPIDLISGKMFLDFMTEKYMVDHYELIEYMSSEETFKLVKSKYPDGGKGYVQIFVKKEKEKHIPYGVAFVAFKINQKDWGLGFNNSKKEDFLFFECLYENDETKFKGCYKK